MPELERIQTRHLSGETVDHNAVCSVCSQELFQCVGCEAELDLKVRRKKQ